MVSGQVLGCNLAIELEDTVNKAPTKLKKDSKIQTTPIGRKPKKNTYGLTPGISPFPELARPTAGECEEPVVAPLRRVRIKASRTDGTSPHPVTDREGSGMVSGGLVQRFGILSEGIGKGSVNWDAVRPSPHPVTDREGSGMVSGALHTP
jgi:DNA-(apurinic or apyrimidinic site) lyase